jgi:VanZ family protein
MRELALLHINDKVQHFAAYAALAFLPAVHERRQFLIFAALGLVGLGILLEFGQMFSVGRFFEFGDMVADAAGICIGVAIGLPFARRYQLTLDG